MWSEKLLVRFPWTCLLLTLALKSSVLAQSNKRISSLAIRKTESHDCWIPMISPYHGQWNITISSHECWRMFATKIRFYFHSIPTKRECFIPNQYGGFLSHRGSPNVLIHFERWDFPVHKNPPAIKGVPPFFGAAKPPPPRSHLPLLALSLRALHQLPPGGAHAGADVSLWFPGWGGFPLDQPPPRTRYVGGGGPLLGLLGEDARMKKWMKGSRTLAILPGELPRSVFRLFKCSESMLSGALIGGSIECYRNQFKSWRKISSVSKRTHHSVWLLMVGWNPALDTEGFLVDVFSFLQFGQHFLDHIPQSDTATISPILSRCSYRANGND